MLSQKEKLDLLNEFPNIKLSYEIITHKKVYDADLLFGIPDGNKCFAWFTSFKERMLCVILEVDDKNNKEIKHIKVVNSCFTSTLCYGTLFFGTLFYHMNNPFFTLEDIYIYKGNNITDWNINKKLDKISTILKNEIKQISYNNNYVVFGLPLIAKNNDDFNIKISSISYKLNSIQYYYFNKKSRYILSFNEFKQLMLIKEPLIKEPLMKEPLMKDHNRQLFKKENVFICKPDIQNDVYNLYSFNNENNENEYIGLACVPDYKTSVMMNKLFRIIKENNDLDKLEESDDEEEFENENIDKFVHLNKSCKMICNFNNKFKKWVPIKILE